MTGRWSALLLAAAIGAAGCTGSAASSAEQTSLTAAPAARAETPSEEPSAADPVAAALEAYEDYTTASVEAMAAGDMDAVDADEPGVAGLAAGAAVEHLRDRLAANAAEGIVVTGSLETSATVDDVDLSADGDTATLRDCVLNGLGHVSADDGSEVAAATGWRQPVDATIEQRDGQWVVTEVTVPLENEVGPVTQGVPDPPLLRGPATSDRAPSCVPDEMEDGLVEAYLAYQEAFDVAVGMNPDRVPRPATELLDATAIDPELSRARAVAEQLDADGQAIVGSPDVHDVAVVSMTDFDRTAVVFDCLVLGDSKLVEQDSGDAVFVPEEGKISLYGAELAAVDDGWKVAAVEVLDEGVQECEFPE